MCGRQVLGNNYFDPNNIGCFALFFLISNLKFKIKNPTIFQSEKSLQKGTSSLIRGLFVTNRLVWTTKMINKIFIVTYGSSYVSFSPTVLLLCVSKSNGCIYSTTREISKSDTLLVFIFKSSTFS